GESYTRAVALTVDADGIFAVNGYPVLGESGPIVLPPFAQLDIGVAGTISVQPPGQQARQAVDRLKLVRPQPGELTKNEAGLVVSRPGQALPAENSVAVRS